MDKARTIMSNPDGILKYFGWPSVTLLQNGKIAVSASGLRYAHFCPFGKGVISFSEDGGKTYTPPCVVIDTPLDDRDTGIVAFGKSSVIVTSFNNTTQLQRNAINSTDRTQMHRSSVFAEAYLDMIDEEEEKKYLGSEFRFSHDCGITFGPLYKSPITSPHGPVELHDGTLLWVGRTFSKDDTMQENDAVKAYVVHMDGSMTYRGTIPAVFRDGKKILSCEPHTIELADGTLLCHIRVQAGLPRIFTIYQAVSADQGFTWSQPQQLLEDLGGAPAHLIRHSTGMILSVYGYREKPYGIRVICSADVGKSWSAPHPLFEDGLNGDIGYPCTVELPNGDLLTVFYAQDSEPGPAVIRQTVWRIES